MRPDDPSEPTRPGLPDQAPVEDIVAEFLLEREEGRNPSIDEYLARHPKHAEVLAKLLSDDTASPATMRRRTTGRGTGTPAPAKTRTLEGMRLGDYEVIEHVSTAGGGTVYRARHVVAGHVVALKVLDARGAIDPRDIERFHRESAMLRAMNLVNVVPVLDAGEDGGRSWIAMKWLEGDTFSKLREAAADETHRLHDLRERARLVARVARTFAAIHGYGILHRDVKPTNIMVDRAGEPMIIDFGIAHAPDLPELTATTDQIMGTPRFLAPELLAGGNREFSPRTDVYGLGLCLYEICTGTEAFKQATRADLFTAIRTTGPADPRAANPALSHDFAAVILRAIEIDPARRYPDMTALADDLERVARGESPEPATLRGAHPLLRMLRRNRKRLIAAALLAAVLIPAIWLSTRKAIEGMRASDDEKTLRPFAWFAPEAFGDVGLPSKSVAAELARNPSASAEQRLIAAWIPFMTRDVTGALSHVGAREDAPEDPFAVRLFRAQLSQVEARGPGHAVGTFVDTRTSKPKINPETGRPYEVLVPTDPGLSLARAASGFSAAVKRVSETTPPRGAVDFLVEANLVWAMLPSSPEVDTSKIRAAILEALRKAMESDPGSLPALHLRGVVRFLSGDFAGARDDLGAVVRDQPAALGAKYLLGIALCKLGDWAEARAVLETAAAGFAPTHPAHHKALGHLALARAGAGDCDRALESCAAWWEAATTWQDVVIPRVIGANIRKNQGKMQEARALLVTAMREEERLWQADLARHGTPTTGPHMFLWGPLIEQLLAVAEALDDLDMVDEIRDKIDRGGIALRPNPASAESFLLQNLAGLRPADADRIKTSPVYGTSENK